MLTGYQCEVVAYYPPDSGEYVCPDCARKIAGTEIAFAKAERGMADWLLQPVIRYSMDESNGERVYEYADQLARDWEMAHPGLAELLLNEQNRWRLIDWLADRLEDVLAERCGECGEILD
jgi:hypothetical protein